MVPISLLAWEETLPSFVENVIHAKMKELAGFGLPGYEVITLFVHHVLRDRAAKEVRVGAGEGCSTHGDRGIR